MIGNYAFEFLNEDAEIRVIIFDIKGNVLKDYISLGVRGNPNYIEPKNNELFICRVAEEYTNKEGENGYNFQQIGVATLQDEEYVYEAVENLLVNKADWQYVVGEFLND